MNEKNKELLKKFLLRFTIFLTALWAGLFLYGIFFERQIDIRLEKNDGQLYTIDLSNQLENISPHSVEELKNNNEESKKTSSQENLDKPDARAPDNGKAKIAIIVTNLGTNKNLTETALKLPSNVTLGFSAYTTGLKMLYNQAVKTGFDVFVYMPFEPKDYPLSDPGLYAILTANPAEKNISIVSNIISTFPGAKGIYGNYREVLSINKTSFLPIVEFMQQKDLKIFLGRNFSDDSPNYLSENSNVIGGDIIIDLVPDPDAIRHSLANLLALAKSKKKAVGFVNSYPVSLNILSTWLSSFNDNEVEIVPLSRLFL